MSLSHELLAVFFGRATPPASVQVALALDGRELSDPGYSRAFVSRGSWRVADSVASTPVDHGPFENGVEFDEMWLVLAGEKVDVARLDGTVSLLPGMAVTNTYHVTF